MDAGGAVPKLTWIGCAVLDDKKAWLNSLAPLPDGGLVVTSMYDPTDPQAFVSLGQGKNKGIVFEWQPASGRAASSMATTASKCRPTANGCS